MFKYNNNDIFRDYENYKNIIKFANKSILKRDNISWKIVKKIRKKLIDEWVSQLSHRVGIHQSTWLQLQQSGKSTRLAPVIKTNINNVIKKFPCRKKSARDKRGRKEHLVIQSIAASPASFHSLLSLPAVKNLNEASWRMDLSPVCYHHRVGKPKTIKQPQCSLYFTTPRKSQKRMDR